MDDRRPYRPAHDPENRIQGNNESVPNVIPHIHGSTTGKRYCDHCGQRMIESELHQHKEYQGKMALPVLRSRSNLETVFISEGAVSKQIVALIAGFVQPTTPIARDQDIQIGQLPKGSTRAHINIRDVAVIATPVAGAVTNFSGFLYYTDIANKNHIIAAFSFTASAVPQVFNVWSDTLVSESVITDGAPPNLGTFSVEVIAITLGAATSVTFDVRANLAVMFEV